MTSKEVVTTINGEVVELSPRAIELIDKLGIKMADPLEIQFEIAERLANAQSPEELFREDQATGWREMQEKPHMVRSVKWLPSTYPGSIGFYGIVNAVDTETGEQRILTTGSVGVMMQLARGLQMDWFDQPVMLIESPNETANGGRPLKLIRL